MPVISAPKKQRQGDYCKLEAYMVRSFLKRKRAGRKKEMKREREKKDRKI